MIRYFGWAAEYPVLLVIGEIVYYGAVIAAAILFLYLAARKWFLLEYPKRRIALFTGVFAVSLLPLVYTGSRGAGMLNRPFGEWGAALLMETIRYGTTHTFHGGLVLSVLFLAILSFLFRFRVLAILDAAFLYVPLAHATGRLGCLVAGCCWGRYVSVNLAGLEAGFQNPVPLYAIAANVAIFLFLRRIYGLVYAGPETRERCRGAVAASYLVLYSPVRFIMEVFRTEPEILPGLSQAQIVMGLFLLTGAAILLVIGYRCCRSRPASAGTRKQIRFL